MGERLIGESGECLGEEEDKRYLETEEGTSRAVKHQRILVKLHDQKDFDPEHLKLFPTLFQDIAFIQFGSIARSCPTLCDPMDCSTRGFPVHQQLPELAQTHGFN